MRKIVFISLAALCFLLTGGLIYSTVWNSANKDNVEKIYESARAAAYTDGDNTVYICKECIDIPVVRYIAATNALRKSAEMYAESVIQFEAENIQNGGYIDPESHSDYVRSAEIGTNLVKYMNVHHSTLDGIWPYHHPMVEYIAVRDEVFEKILHLEELLAEKDSKQITKDAMEVFPARIPELAFLSVCFFGGYIGAAGLCILAVAAVIIKLRQ